VRWLKDEAIGLRVISLIFKLYVIIPRQYFKVGEFFDRNGFDEQLGGLHVDRSTVYQKRKT